MAEQQSLPTMEGPALVLGPVLVCFELEGTPETRSYAADLRKAAKEAYGKGRWPSDKPVALMIHAFMPVPVLWSEVDHRAALIGAKAHIIDPSGQDILKCCSDCLNDIVWLSRKQIVDARIIKRFADIPAIRIEAREFVSP